MTSPSVTTTTTKPLQRLALHSTSTCASQAAAYGKCILATYTDVTKGACAEQFAEFGKCLRTAVRLVASGCTWAQLTNVSDEPQVVEQPVLNYVHYPLYHTYMITANNYTIQPSSGSMAPGTTRFLGEGSVLRSSLLLSPLAAAISSLALINILKLFLNSVGIVLGNGRSSSRGSSVCGTVGFRILSMIELGLRSMTYVDASALEGSPFSLGL
jgi:NADH dehydrogenase [ubiquinone] 1 alpha subcomplex assembly factor 8